MKSFISSIETMVLIVLIAGCAPIASSIDKSSIYSNPFGSNGLPVTEPFSSYIITEKMSESFNGVSIDATPKQVLNFLAQKSLTMNLDYMPPNALLVVDLTGAEILESGLDKFDLLIKQTASSRYRIDVPDTIRSSMWELVHENLLKIRFYYQPVNIILDANDNSKNEDDDEDSDDDSSEEDDSDSSDDQNIEKSEK